MISITNTPNGKSKYSMATKRNNDVFSLHRYFIWADRMKVHFDHVLKNTKGTNKSFGIETELYMSYWYAGLYVVIEGWRKLKLSDPAINDLLKSPNVDLLKKYRHYVFHYQRQYYDEKRMVPFICNGENPVKWIRELREAFSIYFLTWLKEQNL